MKSIHIVEENLPMAWEKAVIACWEQGDNFKTEYDKIGDPNSRDVSALIHITNPMAEPRIHRCFPGGLDDLEKYRSEVLFGAHDHWVSPQEGKWQYTYHQRLREYECNSRSVPDGFAGFQVNTQTIDQIAECIKILKKTPHTRRAQAITWQPWNDLGVNDAACLQRIWFRVEKAECNKCKGKGGKHVGSFDSYCSCSACLGRGYFSKLNMNVHFRSNDAFKASFLNMYAFSELQAMVAREVGVESGELIWQVDSYHIYGSYFSEFEGFLKTVENRTKEERVYTTDFAIPFFIDGCDTLLAEEDMPEDKKVLVRARKEYLVSLGK